MGMLDDEEMLNDYVTKPRIRKPKMAAALSPVETVTGTIEAKSRDGKKIKIGEEWFSSFSPTAYERDMVVTVNYVRKGIFNNIKTISLATGEEKSGATAQAKDSSSKTAPAVYKRMGNFPIDPLDGQVSIIRQNALTNAVKLYVDGGFLDDALEETVAAEKVITIARIFEDYTAGFSDKRSAEKAVEEMTSTKE